MGATEEQLAALERGEVDWMEPAWRAAVRYAEAITPTRGRADDALFEELRAHWTEPQLVEITLVITLFNHLNRFAEALEIPPTR